MNLVLHIYSQATQDRFSLVMSSCATTIALSALLALRWKRIRDSYPAYHEIPSTVLNHMATKEELRQLDNQVDVIVSTFSTGNAETDSDAYLTYAVIFRRFEGRWKWNRWTDHC